MSRQRSITYLIVFSLITGCQSGGQETTEDSADQGKIYISADESFKPVIDSQVQIYESRHPDARLVVNYKPEADCIRDMRVDSVKMVIITRSYSEYEEQVMIDSLKIAPSRMKIAYDAIAVIVNPKSPDSLFTMGQIRQILTGNFNKNLIPVFDGLKATSTVRFIVDSVLRGDSLTKKALAARSSEEVLEYVSRTPDAVGFIGVSWIGNPEDARQQSFLTKVKVAQIESTDMPGRYIYPVQANIALGRYPLIRDVWYILKGGRTGSLAHGFANFLSGERGQLIFRRAYLLPARLDFNVRSASLSEKRSQ
jgi:phosphate transport system substrate-binding protein